jgi:hypothetical protein
LPPGLLQALPFALRCRQTEAQIERQLYGSAQTGLLLRFPNSEMRCHPAGSSGVSVMTIVALGILAVVILLIVLTAVNGSQSTL